jgi:hypothetical protein
MSLTIVKATVLGFLMCVPGAVAQEGRLQEIGLQGTGFFTEDSICVRVHRL